MKIHVTLDNDDLGEFDLLKVRNFEYYDIENQFGLTTKQFMDGIGELRASAVDALIWLMYKRLGRVVDKNLIQWDLTTLKLEQVDEPDPSEAVNGTADASTSDTSPTSAT